MEAAGHVRQRLTEGATHVRFSLPQRPARLLCVFWKMDLNVWLALQSTLTDA